jgi:hypothetical protein
MMIDAVMPTVGSAEQAIRRIDDDAQSINIGQNAAPRHERSIAILQTPNISAGPRSEEVSDRTHPLP